MPETEDLLRQGLEQIWELGCLCHTQYSCFACDEELQDTSRCHCPGCLAETSLKEAYGNNSIQNKNELLTKVNLQGWTMKELRDWCNRILAVFGNREIVSGSLLDLGDENGRKMH